MRWIEEPCAIRVIQYSGSILVSRLRDSDQRSSTEGERTMAYQGKIQLTMVFVAPPDQVKEGDRIFRTHGPWMKETHHRSGDKALLSYTVSKAPELSNPMDPSS